MAIRSVDVPTLKRWMDSGEAVLVDVREPAEHEAEKIAGAVLVPLATLTRSQLPNYTGKKLVLHCRKGGRGSTACEKLLAEDPSLEVYNLQGGITAWTEVGLEAQASGKFFLPLDRQVQLIIGLLLLVASVLAYFVSPLFMLITGFLGAGLSFAGLTGFCGLAMLIARMPWNQRGKADFCSLR